MANPKENHEHNSHKGRSNDWDAQLFFFLGKDYRAWFRKRLVNARR